MTSAAVQLRAPIVQALAACASGPLAERSRGLLSLLGYRSDRRIDVGPAATDFLAAFNGDGRLNPESARVAQWRSAEMVFQLTGEEITRDGQASLLETLTFEARDHRSFLFVAIELDAKPGARPYTRGELAAITREANKLFAMPVSVIFRHPSGGETLLTLAIVTHRPGLRGDSRDAREKVSLIRDVYLASPHRGHIEILAGLARGALATRQAIAGFNDLQQAWARALDITELHRRFYREIADWHYWAVQRVAFPDDGAPPARRNVDRVIRLITSLIFVWFLREKGLVEAHLFQRADVERMLISLNDEESTYYKAILQNLFFGTLNQEMGKRAFQRPNQNQGAVNLYNQALFRDPEAALTLFERTPCLNGGLFDGLDDFEQKPPVRIDPCSDRPDSQPVVPNALFFTERPLQVDLNTNYGTQGRRYEVRGLLEILESYKFTLAENTPVEEDVALDPELLGLVFENLLAAHNPETETTARKETGSFYTPRSIVAYMVDESLLIYLRDHLARAAPRIPGFDEQARATLDERLRDLLAYNDLQPRFSRAEVGHLISAIDALTVIDPACGAGAFPMGGLQKLVYLLGKLDPRNQGWKARQTARAEKIEDPAARRAAMESLEEAFERNELDYGRKLFLIENCIYGVDIQPIAVQIARLRCLISLIVDQQVHDERENRGMRPLPNLETKFIAADALNSVKGPGQRRLRDARIETLVRELAEVRSQHFSARTQATKRKCHERDRELREELRRLLHPDGVPSAADGALAAWDPYAQNSAARFFDPEWMFGRAEGFDLVIANPPYVRQEQIKERKPDLQGYETYTGTADLYVYFYERAMKLLRPGGVLTFISSNKFYRAGYGQKLRRYLAASATLHQMIDFGDTPVFTATAYPSIIIAQKGAPPAGHELLALTWRPTSSLEELPAFVASARAAAAAHTPAAPIMLQRSLAPDGWRLEGAAAQRLLEKLRRAGRPLGDYVGGRFYRGILTGLNEAFVVDRATYDRLVIEHSSSADLLRPFLRGRDVKRWRAHFAEQYLIKIESSENRRHPWSGQSEVQAESTFAREYPAIHRWLEQFRSALASRYDQGHYYWELRACAYWQEFEQPKIVLPAISAEVAYAHDYEHRYSNDKTSALITSQTPYLLGILNSSVLWYVIRHTAATRQGGFYEFKPMYVTQLPIPAPSNTAPIPALVERILALKGEDAGADVTALEREIDERAYALYGLRPDEIQAVEEQTHG